MSDELEAALVHLTDAVRDVVTAAAAQAAAPEPAQQQRVDWNPLRLYSVAEVAKLTSTGASYVYGEIKSGRLPKVELSNGDRKKTRVRATDLAAWIDNRRVMPAAREAGGIRRRPTRRRGAVHGPPL